MLDIESGLSDRFIYPTLSPYRLNLSRKIVSSPFNFSVQNKNMADEKIVSDDVNKDDIEKDVSKSDKKEDETEIKSEKKEEEEEIPVRASTFQYIIARKNKQIEKLKAKEDEEEELTPEANEALDKKLDERFAPFREGEIARETESLLNNLYADEPEAKEFDKIIRKFMTFEKNGVKPYEHIPPAVIYHHLAFGSAEQTGAKKRNAANIEANLSKTKGRTNRPKTEKTASGLPSVEDMEEMSDADFSKKIIAPALQG